MLDDLVLLGEPAPARVLRAVADRLAGKKASGVSRVSRDRQSSQEVSRKESPTAALCRRTVQADTANAGVSPPVCLGIRLR